MITKYNKIFLIGLPMLFSVFLFGFRKNQCSKKNSTSNVLEIIKRQGHPAIGKKSSFSYYNKYISDLHQEAFDLFKINNDTSFISTCTIIDEVSFEGGPIYGKIIINDTDIYFYSKDAGIKNKLKIETKSHIINDTIVSELLVKGKYNELEKLSLNGKSNISGSIFYFIVKYDRTENKVYTNLLPVF